MVGIGIFSFLLVRLGLVSGAMSVDGSEILHYSWYGKYSHLFTGILYIPGARFLPSTVCDLLVSGIGYLWSKDWKSPPFDAAPVFPDLWRPISLTLLLFFKIAITCSPRFFFGGKRLAMYFFFEIRNMWERSSCSHGVPCTWQTY